MTVNNQPASPKNPPATPLAKLRSLVIAKAQSDPEFLKLLKTNPHQAFEQCGFHSLPKDMKVNVVTETEKERWLVIPYLNLDAAAGGYNLCTVAQIACGACDC